MSRLLGRMASTRQNEKGESMSKMEDLKEQMMLKKLEEAIERGEYLEDIDLEDGY